MSTVLKRVRFADVPVTHVIPVFSPELDPPLSTILMPTLSFWKPDEAKAAQPYLEFNKSQEFTQLAWDVHIDNS